MSIIERPHTDVNQNPDNHDPRQYSIPPQQENNNPTRTERKPSSSAVSRRTMLGIGAVGVGILAAVGVGASVGGEKSRGSGAPTPTLDEEQQREANHKEGAIALATATEAASKEGMDKFNLTPGLRARLDAITLDSLRDKTFDEIAEDFTITTTDLGLDPTTADPNDFARAYTEAMCAFDEKRENLFNAAPEITGLTASSEVVAETYYPMFQATAKGMFGTSQEVSSSDGADAYYNLMIKRITLFNSTYVDNYNDPDYEGMRPAYTTVTPNLNSVSISGDPSMGFDMYYECSKTEIDNSVYLEKVVGASSFNAPDNVNVGMQLINVYIDDLGRLLPSEADAMSV